MTAEAISGLRADFTTFVQQYGVPVSIKNKVLSYSGAEYDTAYWTGTGAVVSTSGLLMPLNAAGVDQRFLAQGLVTQTDMKLFLGSTFISEQADIVTVGGSWTVVDQGIFNWPDTARIVYKKVLIRRSQY